MTMRSTINGKTMGENVAERHDRDADVIRALRPAADRRGRLHGVQAAICSTRAIMKTSVISDEFRQRFLSNPKDQNAFEGRAVVFEGPEDYHHRIDDPALEIDEHTLLFIRGVGPIGYPGSAEVVNMQPPADVDQKRALRAALHRRRPAVRAPRARPPSSMPRRKRRPAAGSRCSRPATACASISTRAPPTS